jgi:hypothetical protein
MRLLSLKGSRLYVTRRFIDVITRALERNFNLLNPTQTLMSYFFKIHIDFILSSASKSQNMFLPLETVYQETYTTYLSVLILVLHSTLISYVTFKMHSNFYLTTLFVNRISVTGLILKDTLISTGTSVSITDARSVAAEPRATTDCHGAWQNSMGLEEGVSKESDRLIARAKSPAFPSHILTPHTLRICRVSFSRH